MSDQSSMVKFEVTAPNRGPAEQAHFEDPERRIGMPNVVETVMSTDLGALSAKVSGIIEQLSSAVVPKRGGPNETEIEFAISLDADGSVIFASLGSSVSMKVKVTLVRE